MVMIDYFSIVLVLLVKYLCYYFLFVSSLCKYSYNDVVFIFNCYLLTCFVF